MRCTKYTSITRHELNTSYSYILVYRKLENSASLIYNIKQCHWPVVEKCCQGASVGDPLIGRVRLLRQVECAYSVTSRGRGRGQLVRPVGSDAA